MIACSFSEVMSQLNERIYGDRYIPLHNSDKYKQFLNVGMAEYYDSGICGFRDTQIKEVVDRCYEVWLKVKDMDKVSERYDAAKTLFHKVFQQMKIRKEADDERMSMAIKAKVTKQAKKHVKMAFEAYKDPKIQQAMRRFGFIK
jgi:hypothetical protein